MLSLLSRRNIAIRFFILMNLTYIASPSTSTSNYGQQETVADLDIVLSCIGATSNFQSNYCNMVTWTPAKAYSKSTFSIYATGTPRSVSEQEGLVRSLIKANVENQNDNSCKDAIKRFFCMEIFPECPEHLLGKSTTYFPSCKVQCDQATLSGCPLKYDCSSLPTDNCVISVPTGYFVLHPSQGPFTSLPIIYAVVLAVWVIYAILWNVATFFVYKESCVIVCRALASIPIIKVAVLILAESFWATCVKWDMCSFWLGVSLLNTHLVYETGILVAFLLLAKGWSITRETFPQNEWRGVIMSMSAFYMSNSIILVLNSSVFSQIGFWIASAILYGLMYRYIFKCVFEQLAITRNQVMLLSPTMPHHIAGPLKGKLKIYYQFLILVFLSMCIEVYVHSMAVTESRLWPALFTYEFSNMMIVGAIGWIFRPREFSPFFFMVPAVMDDARIRPIPVIDAAYDTQDDPEVDLAPLLPNEDALAFEILGGAGAGIENPSRMIIMSNPDKGVSVGLSGARNGGGHSHSSHSNGMSRHGNIGSELSHSLQALTTASVGTSNMSYRSRGDWSRNTLQSSHDGNSNSNNTMINRNLANFGSNSNHTNNSNDISSSIGRSLWRRSNDNSNRESANHLRNDGSRDLPINR